MTDPIRILIVDDDLDTLHGTARLLEKAGYAVDTADSGEAALQAVEQHSADILLVDYEMPGLDGLEVCARIKQDPTLAALLVVVVSGRRIDSDDQAEGLEGGADGYIARPIANRELLARVRAFARVVELTRALTLRASEPESALRELRQAERLLRESQSKLQEAQRIAHMGSWQLKLATGYIDWSEELSRIFGLDPDSAAPNYAEQKSLLTPESWERLNQAVSHTRETGKPYEVELEIVRPSGEHVWVLGRGEAIRDESQAIVGLQGVALDISERKQTETYREMGSEILRILAEPGPLQGSIQRVLAVIKARTGFDAVGIRLQVGDDFPYSVQEGFSEEFLLTENTLVKRGTDGQVCRDGHGKVLLECTCGLVISGQTDPTNPLLTKTGTFWTNDSFPILKIPADQDPRLDPRNRCIHHGYASIALVPIRVKEQVIGLLQLNDHRKGCFSATSIEHLEGIAVHFGEALVRKRAEEDLQESEARMRAITDSAQDAILMMDPEGKISYWNPAAEGMLGYTVAEAMGQNLHRLLVPQQYQAAQQAAFPEFQRTGQGAVVGRTLDLTARRKDGQEISVQLSLSALHRQDGWHAVGILRDITARKLAEAELQRSNDQLEQTTLRANEMAVRAEMASVAKSEFLANMSHEIRTPLNGVLGMIDLLLDTNLSADQRHYAQIVRASGDGLMSLINQILDLSKIEAGKIELESLDFSLHGLLDDFTRTMALQAREKGLALVCLVAPGVPDDLRGDTNRLRQILLNLTGNAIKFTAQGEVSLRLSLVSESPGLVQLRFAVQDSGPGIPADKLKKLFLQFSQVDSSTTRVHGGTGLGLVISKQLAQLMGGEVGVSSRVGQGSEFWFTVRLARASALPPPLKSTPGVALEAGLGPARILVVEDNITNQKVALGVLKKLGMQAEAANNGAEALLALQSTAYEAVLMDVQMPVMDGLEATRQIRDPKSPVLNHQIPIIALTAHALQRDREKCLEAGMNDFLTKPINLGALVGALRKWLPPPSADAQNKIPVFHRAALMQRVMNDEELARVVIEGFLEDMPSQIEQLKAHCAANDAHDLSQQAHKIKGAAATLGGEALGTLAAALEQIGQRGELSTLSGRLAELDAQFEALREALQQELGA